MTATETPQILPFCWFPIFALGMIFRLIMLLIIHPMTTLMAFMAVFWF